MLTCPFAWIEVRVREHVSYYETGNPKLYDCVLHTVFAECSCSFEIVTMVSVGAFGTNTNCCHAGFCPSTVSLALPETLECQNPRDWKSDDLYLPQDSRALKLRHS